MTNLDSIPKFIADAESYNAILVIRNEKTKLLHAATGWVLNMTSGLMSSSGKFYAETVSKGEDPKSGAKTFIPAYFGLETDKYVSFDDVNKNAIAVAMTDGDLFYSVLFSTSMRNFFVVPVGTQKPVDMAKWVTGYGG